MTKGQIVEVLLAIREICTRNRERNCSECELHDFCKLNFNYLSLNDLRRIAKVIKADLDN